MLFCSHEAQCIEGIHDALIAKQLRPAEHYVDAAYVDALLLASEQQKGIETVGPARVDPSWQNRTEGAYSVDQFEIRLCIEAEKFWSLRRSLQPLSTSFQWFQTLLSTTASFQ